MLLADLIYNLRVLLDEVAHNVVELVAIQIPAISKILDIRYA